MNMTRLGIGTLLIALALLAQGCSMFSAAKAPDPYQAGRTFVFVDTLTEPYQPDELALAVDQIYVLARANTTLGLDELVRAELDTLYKDATPEMRETVFIMYKAIKAKLTDQIDLNPDLPSLEVIDEFFRGVRDALAIYQPERS